MSIFQRFFGSSNDRKVKGMSARVDKIAALEPAMQALSDEQLRAKTVEFRERLAKGATLDDLLEEAFAVVREAAKRVLGQRHYDVQMVGGMILHRGGIAEMRTGEGKTLVATGPVYLNALEAKGVHVITVNDYLAQRDSEWMGQVYRFLGLTVGVIVHGLSQNQRQEAYGSDITYGTNNEFGFDYLRDNLVYDANEMVQRGHNFVVVDEVDSILIDEARTPLIISGPTEDRSDVYRTIDILVKELIQDPTMYDYDEKQRQVILTEEGSERVEEMAAAAGHLAEDSAGLYDPANISIVHHINQALRANVMYVRDKDYIVRAGEVILIDEFTGRMMQGRRLSEGLHQAIEAKEGAVVQPENQTLASVTIQNYFRLYSKLSGMTGTAATEAQEFIDIYKMDVAEIPTNRPVKRIDDDDEVYRTAAEKNRAVALLIEDCYRRKQPILVGTVSIEKSETLSEILKAHTFELDGKTIKGIPHNVLNARFHEQEASIVADAGIPGAVTIATNMAGRGTDIQLGGNVDMRLAAWREQQRDAGIEVTPQQALDKKAEIELDIKDLKEQSLAAGGLFVLGTERHESRRIDNQLRGRTGRQGDPGHSKFFLSCEDDLLRIFAGERLDSIMRTFGVQEGEAITHKWLNSAIATAQKRVEQRNYEIRKNLLKYDDVINDQRKAVFEQRQEFMEATDLQEIIGEFRSDTIADLVNRHLPPKAYAEQWDVEGLDAHVQQFLGLQLPITEWAAEEGIANEEIEDRIRAAADARAAERSTMVGDHMRNVEKSFLLQTIDLQWREHLMHIDHLRTVIGLRGYGQRDPLNEFKTEAFSLFEKLLTDLRQNVTRWLMTVEFSFEEPPEQPRSPQTFEVHLDPLTGENELERGFVPDGISAEQRQALPVTALPDGWEDTGRNQPCPCASGKKFKHCHGALI
ncbi:MAG: preprotein translocase subunit SecA [Alphaproteobacteria bacterium]|nr:preprotein translocase subunit SecA [Alphaproteobacteria bacterium]MBU1513362.1 preprotein translocase subunit SecA [Alphaproteobacteria bacterium]MBU2096354.1 preprotein translocase subunit SecA [Alphaproteobacteria bacterium]MBU2149954.1 preprotein translocase subunit SecA [Alphaproteobacteria bacterium]MBU2309848.1 preprotein translocase subunit SecA [Alphaproteobacteria bacterium]